MRGLSHSLVTARCCGVCYAMGMSFSYPKEESVEQPCQRDACTFTPWRALVPEPPPVRRPVRYCWGMKSMWGTPCTFQMSVWGRKTTADPLRLGDHCRRGQWSDSPCPWGVLERWGVQGRGGASWGAGSSQVEWIRAKVKLKAREGLCKQFLLQLLFVFPDNPFKWDLVRLQD